jgi:diacylglycerol kinase family enzyme
VRVGLIFNEQAGDATSMADLVTRIARHGHTVTAVAPPGDGVRGLPLAELDVVAVAGGDGTVGTAMAAMPDGRVPIAALPTGTANNIATSLDVPADVDDAIGLWRTARVRPLDIGIATGPWGEHRFVESVGGGLVTHGIVVMDRRNDRHPTPAGHLERARHAHADLLGEIPGVEWEMVLDDTAVRETLVLVEILNAGRVGPSLAFADASPFDGLFTVVAAGEGHRGLLTAWLREGASTLPPSPLAVWTASRISITRGDRLHLDDEVVDAEGETAPVTVRVDAGAVSVLVE